ncbi:hypothetical protein BJ546DRAFT_368441 [Cryomyces antarcticus]
MRCSRMSLSHDVADLRVQAKMCRAQASDLGSGPHPRNLEQPHAATSISIKSVGKARIRRPSPFHLDPTVNCPPDALGLASVMTRPKVPEDKRQRTATACDSCKRRKQKCNGLCPCITCAKVQGITAWTVKPHH